MLYAKEKLEELRNRWTTRKGKNFLKKIKETRCYLNPVIFRKKIRNFPSINDKEVKNKIDLRGAVLCGFDFKAPVKDGDIDFTEELAILSNIHFEGAILKHCNFEEGKIHDCFFENADLSHADFQHAAINNCNFQETDCTGINFRGAKLINCNFNDAVIKDMTTAETIIDQKTTFGKNLKSEKEGNFHFASIEYKQIKQMYKNSSLHEHADHYHCKEMVAKRKTISKKNPLRWLNFIFGELLCRYGTSFFRVFLASLLVIVVCASLFFANHSLYYYNEPIESPSFFQALYFSIVTFTTVGYGDYHAVGWIRFLAASEAFIGAALISLFTVTVARKIIRD